MADLLNRERVLCHPLVLDELAIGQLKIRRLVMELLNKLPEAIVAREEEVLHFIERHALFGTCFGYVEASLLTSIKLQPHASLWTGDKRMHAAAAAKSIRADPLH